jgi:type II secretory ATPase GspE/PulE/Tfp pilus assembly ATPase PilB-like protein
MKLSPVGEPFRNAVSRLKPADDQYVPQVIEALLQHGRSAGASDLHLTPESDGIHVGWRIDGVLHAVADFPAKISSNLIARLKVLSELLTYKTDAPQEGRIRSADAAVEMRVSTFPTLFGEKAVVRIFAASKQLLRLADLGLPTEIADVLGGMLHETSGLILITGPAGSGKTTTAYSLLREIAARTEGSRSLASLEDPIEVVVPGVAQSQTNAVAGFTLATGLRSLVRQDPEVIFVGEIRDPVTAEGVFNTVLTGHLVVSTFHAGSAAGAVSRLCDMGIEPYLLRSSVLAIVSQRLARRLCECAPWSDDPGDSCGLDVARRRSPRGCPACNHSGYSGRLVLAEMLAPERSALGRAILSREDADSLDARAIEAGMIPLREQARRAVELGWTSALEIRRVLGIGRSNGPGESAS